MLKGKRSEKIALELKQVIAQALLIKARDPRLGFVTVTDVSLSPDMKNAVVYISIMGDEKQRKSTLIALNHAHGFYKQEIASNLNLRYTPRITFEIDKSVDQAIQIDKIIHKIHAEDGPAEEYPEAPLEDE